MLTKNPYDWVQSKQKKYKAEPWCDYSNQKKERKKEFKTE